MVQLQGSARLEPPWDRSILVCKSHQICNFCHNSTWSRQVIRFKDCNSMRSKWCLALWVQSQRTFPQEVQVDWAWLDSITILVSKMLMCHCNDMQRQNSKKGTCPNMGSQSPWIELLMACCHHQTYPLADGQRFKVIMPYATRWKLCFLTPLTETLLLRILQHVGRSDLPLRSQAL